MNHRDVVRDRKTVHRKGDVKKYVVSPDKIRGAKRAFFILSIIPIHQLGTCQLMTRYHGYILFYYNLTPTVIPLTVFIYKKTGEQNMKKYIYAIILVLIETLPAAYAGDHKPGNDAANNSCFYDSKPGHNKWHYYFCGTATSKCAGKKYKGPGSDEKKPNNDTRVILKNMETFTFLTNPKDTYCCCISDGKTAGSFIKASNTTNCYTDDAPTETTKDLGSGQSCKQLTYKTVCGTTVTVGCENPEKECGTGYTWRNNSCAPICSGDQVYESETSNTCVACETTTSQGISRDKKYCKKCDKDSEFFNRETKKCIKKSGLQQYSKDVLRECWQCPTELYKNCVKAVTLVNKMGKTGDARLSEIDAVASFDGPRNITSQCKLK